MRFSGWRIVIPCVAAGGVALLVWRFTHPTSAKINISWSPSTNRRATTLLTLSLLEQAKDFSTEGRHQLILQLMELGYLPGVTKDDAEPERFVELITRIRRRVVEEIIQDTF